MQLNCLGWVNCSRLVSLVSRRFQEPVGGKLGCLLQKMPEAAWPPKFSKFMFLGPGNCEGLVGGEGSSWAPCYGSVLLQAEHRLASEFK